MAVQSHAAVKGVPEPAAGKLAKTAARTDDKIARKLDPKVLPNGASAKQTAAKGAPAVKAAAAKVVKPVHAAVAKSASHGAGLQDAKAKGAPSKSAAAKASVETQRAETRRAAGQSGKKPPTTLSQRRGKDDPSG